MWSNLIWEAWCANAYAHLPIKKPPVHLVATSMAHGAGVFAWPAMAFGGTTVCIQKADPLAVMEAIDRHGVTHTFMPPTVIYMMLAHPRAQGISTIQPSTTSSMAARRCRPTRRPRRSTSSAPA